MVQGKQCTRRLSFTTIDSFMGLYSLGVQPGDKVCVLLGGKLLYILRETMFEGRTGDFTLHLFMGNCYVYGLSLTRHRHGRIVEISSASERPVDYCDDAVTLSLLPTKDLRKMT